MITTEYILRNKIKFSVGNTIWGNLDGWDIEAIKDFVSQVINTTQFDWKFYSNYIGDVDLRDEYRNHLKDALIAPKLADLDDFLAECREVQKGSFSHYIEYSSSGTNHEFIDDLFKNNTFSKELTKLYKKYRLSYAWVDLS